MLFLPTLSKGFSFSIKLYCLTDFWESDSLLFFLGLDSLFLISFFTFFNFSCFSLLVSLFFALLLPVSNFSYFSVLEIDFSVIDCYFSTLKGDSFELQFEILFYSRLSPSFFTLLWEEYFLFDFLVYSGIFLAYFWLFLVLNPASVSKNFWESFFWRLDFLCLLGDDFLVILVWFSASSDGCLFFPASSLNFEKLNLLFSETDLDRDCSESIELVESRD